MLCMHSSLCSTFFWSFALLVLLSLQGDSVPKRISNFSAEYLEENVFYIFEADTTKVCTHISILYI